MIPLLVCPCTKLCGACPRMSVGYAEVFPIRGQASAYRTTLLGINPRMGEWGEPDLGRLHRIVRCTAVY